MKIIICALLLIGFNVGLAADEVTDEAIKMYQVKCEKALAKREMPADELEMAVLNCVIELIDLNAKK